MSEKLRISAIGVIGLAILAVTGLTLAGKSAADLIGFLGPIMLAMFGILSVAASVDKLHSKTDDLLENGEIVRTAVNGRMDKHFDDLKFLHAETISRLSGKSSGDPDGDVDPTTPQPS